MHTEQEAGIGSDYVKLLHEIDLAGLGERLRRNRLEKKWSQIDLSADLFTPAYLSSIELGKTRPTYKSLTALAERLDKPLDYFLQPGSGSGAELDEQQTRLMAGRLALLTAQTRLEKMADDEAQAALELVKAYLPRLSLTEGARYHQLHAHYFNLQNLPSDVLAELEEASQALQQGQGSDPEIRVLIEMERGIAHFHQRHITTALTHFQAALDRLDTEPAKSHQPLRWKVQVKAAECLLLHDQPKKALFLYEQALAKAGEILDPLAQADLYLDWAALYQQQGDFGRTALALGCSLEAYAQVKNIRLLLTTANQLTQLYTQTGQ